MGRTVRRLGGQSRAEFTFLDFNDVILPKRPYIHLNKVALRPLIQPDLTLEARRMWRLIKVLLFLTLLAAAGLVAYAYIGPIFFPADFAPERVDFNEPVVLETE